MKLTVSFSKKAGLPNYGSAGASIEITTEVPEGAVSECPEVIVAEIRRSFQLAETEVLHQLARQVEAPAPSAPPEPASLGWVHGDPEPTAPRPTARQAERYDPTPSCNGSMGGIVAGANSRAARQPARQEPRDDTPRDGRQLIAWARRLEESGEFPGLFKRVTAYGKAAGFPSRVVEWSPDDVAAAVAVVMGDDDPEPEPAPVRNGYRNGYHNGNGYHR